MSINTEKINEVLRGLCLSSPDIIGSSVVSSDGFIIASAIPSELDEDLVGGTAVSLLGVGARASTDLMRAQMEQTYVRSPKGVVIVNTVGADSALLLLATPEAKLGMILLEIKRTAAELAKHLS